ncbi:hypothetical protein [Halobacillus naozhouensis]|uniref:TolB protein n=1 Tax=Halobacillus naozhouensis TaxID=554880 RepID=A0ABY8J1K8_9BACI|nr:hypothetical protein [Halobacillus naozhouensis]WFT75424.1 hypothetical protein P9989_03220 [Halobacillus naozhouensis]
MYRYFIAYLSDRSGHFDLWLYNLANGMSVQLTNGAGAPYSIPVWSPGGSKIAFVGGQQILYVVHVYTGAIAQIDQLEEGAGFEFDWSPDGEKLVYTKHDQIILYNVLSHRAQFIDYPGSSNPQWFPNGRELLFQAPDESGISQLFRIRTNGTDVRQITSNEEGPLHDIELSPDGTFVLYTTPGASISLIRTVELSTGNVFEVEGGPLAKNYYPAWSPDSMRVAYSATNFDENNGYFSQIRTVGRMGENERTWVNSNCFATPVSWSPDGRQIAYLSGCTEQEFAREMLVLNLSQATSTRLISGVNIMSMQWAPSPFIRWRRTPYINEQYQVRLNYPSHWEKVNDLRFQGMDGFFQISAISSERTIEEVCHDEALHPLRPYGSMPAVYPTRMHNQEVCFIFPSADQSSEMMGQSAFLIKYPKPVKIQGETYHYFILWADQHHMREIAASLIFLSS